MWKSPMVSPAPGLAYYTGVVFEGEAVFGENRG